MGDYEWTPSFEEGDINQDGLLNILDIVAMVYMIFDSLDYDPLADMDGDGVINILDVVLLVNIILDI